MIFKPELLAKILDGTKAITRRRLPCRYQVDHWYTVQPGRGKKHVCHIFLTKVREERLGDINYSQAGREGFSLRSDFVKYWYRIHGAYDPDERVAVIEWVVYPAVKDCCDKAKEIKELR